VPIAAFTATATPHVQADILAQLHLSSPAVFKTALFRPNLFIRTLPRVQKGTQALLDFLSPRAKESGIIYVATRKQSESLALLLCSKGYAAGPYHAGMSKEARQEAYDAFVHDRVTITVATIAFGMGIDKSNIRFVVHMSLPKTLENYYQEIGRAGRDGESAEALLLFGAEDALLARRRIEEIPDHAHQSLMHEKLNAMMRFASAESCRHQLIAHYFSDNIAPCETACDNCKEGPQEQTDITTDAQKLLSAIMRTQQRFGKTYLIELLQGASTPKILQNNHDTLSVFGIGKERTKKEWLAIVERLLETQALTMGEFKELHLTSKGAQLLRGEAPLLIGVHRLTQKTSKPPKIVPQDTDAALFEHLRERRLELAHEQNIPAYLIFSDKTLKAMASLKPLSKEALLEVGGVGEKKLEAFGEAFLDAIRTYEQGL
jgi:ATP-dependent DNA helicase RecQ